MENQEILRIGKGLDHETYKYLCILIGEGLTFSEHITICKGTLISVSVMLNQSKIFLPFNARLSTYRSILESHFNFATMVWSVINKAM